jgi:hypothetical protein
MEVQVVGVGLDEGAVTVTLVPDPKPLVATTVPAGTVYGVDPMVMVAGFSPA